MRYDINVEYDLTDKGEQLFQAYKEGGLENIVAGKEFGAKSAYAVLAHTTTFTFLMAKEEKRFKNKSNNCIILFNFSKGSKCLYSFNSW